MKSSAVCTALLFLLFSPCFSQLAQWNYEGETLAPNLEGTGVDASDETISNVSHSGFPAGCSSTDCHSVETWNSSSESEAVAANEYFQFLVTALSTHDLTITGLSCSIFKSSSGPSDAAIYLNGSNILSMPTLTASCQSFSISSLNTTVLAGQTATIRIYGWGASSTAGTLKPDNVTVSGTSVLPIELTRIESKSLSNQVILRWETASEINNSHFEIERGRTGLERVFKKVCQS